MKRAVIIDDEQPAVTKLARMVEATGLAIVAGMFTESTEALDFLSKEQVDVAFLDIEMPGIDGLQLAERIIQLQSNLQVIFVTAFSEYAVEAFRIHALDYLLKPVSHERLCDALERVLKDNDIHRRAGRITINCLNKFKVVAAGTDLKFRTAKAEELLAYLVDHGGKSVHRNHIIDVFWNDYDGDRAMVLFNTTLYYLKKAFIQLGIHLKIEFNRGSYQLDMQNIDCDYLEFLRKLEALKPICSENLAAYEETAALYTGDYFEQNEYSWTLQRRLYLKEQYIRILQEISRYYQETGNIQEAKKTIARGLESDSLNSTLNFMLLKTLKKDNDIVALKKYYEAYRTRLITEYGTEPDKACKDLLL